MTRYREIRQVWEQAVGHRIAPHHLAAFYDAPEIRELARFGPGTLRRGADLALEDTGRLRLKHWPTYCRRVLAAAPDAETSRAAVSRRESRAPADRDLHRRVSEILAEKPP